MIILDTNVLSELMKNTPSALVAHWIMSADPAALFTTSITQAEILTGVARLPAGRRRSSLRDATHRMFTEDFRDRVLVFDPTAAFHYAEIMTQRSRRGRPMPVLDAMIAAIARSNGAAIATRNIDDFEGCGIIIHNPWDQG